MMMSPTEIDRLQAEFSECLKFLENEGEISLKSMADDNFRKALLLSSASFFEYKITGIVIDFITESSSSNALVISFVKNRAVNRQYHKWFSWNDKNANSFFALFGSDFKSYMVSKVKEDSELKEAIVAFLELGNERNRLVHQNYATFTLEKNSEEIYNQYKKALYFLNFFSTSLREFLKSKSDDMV